MLCRPDQHIFPFQPEDALNPNEIKKICNCLKWIVDLMRNRRRQSSGSGEFFRFAQRFFLKLRRCVYRPSRAHPAHSIRACVYG